MVAHTDTDNRNRNRQWVYTQRGRLSGTIHRSSGSGLVPTPGWGEIVVRVRAAAVNPCDGQIAQAPNHLLGVLGAPLPDPSRPLVPCYDFAGVVHAAGKDLAVSYEVGDEVFGVALGAVAGHGTLQDYITLPASGPLTRKPASLTWEQAAAIPLVYATAYTALVTYGRLPFDGAAPSSTRDQTHAPRPRSVLILGGSSGTGSVGIQLAKKDGIKSRGYVIDYRREHVPTRALHSLHAPFAVVFDCVGGTELLPYLPNLILKDPTAPELGIYLTIVGDKTGRDEMGGSVTNAYYPAQRLRAVQGSLNDLLPAWLRWLAPPRYACINWQPTKEVYDTVPRFLEAGGGISVDSTYSFEDAPRAFERLESARAKGKVVITVSNG